LTSVHLLENRKSFHVLLHIRPMWWDHEREVQFQVLVMINSNKCMRDVLQHRGQYLVADVS